MTEFICDYCGCVFQTSIARSSFIHHFCSRDCSIKYKKEKNNKVEFECELCGKKIMLLPCHVKNRKYCSLSCAGKMSKPPEGWIVHNKDIPCSDEQKKKISKTLFGRYRKEESPNWKGGVTELGNHIRTSITYKTWRNEVFERDNYTCKRCGKRGGNLEVHHKISFKEILSKHRIDSLEKAENNEELWCLENGIVYCKKCHSEVDSYRRI